MPDAGNTPIRVKRPEQIGRLTGASPATQQFKPRVDHSADGHECHPQARNEMDCEYFTYLDEENDEVSYPREREDAIFWVPHQQRDGELVEFDCLVNTVDDIIVGCGYREEDRELLTDVHRQHTIEFLQYYVGPAVGRVPMLEEK